MHLKKTSYFAVDAPPGKKISQRNVSESFLMLFIHASLCVFFFFSISITDYINKCFCLRFTFTIVVVPLLLLFSCCVVIYLCINKVYNLDFISRNH